MKNSNYQFAQIVGVELQMKTMNGEDK